MRPAQAPTATLTVADSWAETALVRAVVLARGDGVPLPPPEPGAHIRVALPAGGDRPYSLVDLPEHTARGQWVLGVRLEAGGQGGSRHMHGLRAGDRVTIRGPLNGFPLIDDPAPALLLAGGIGITPILSMAIARRRAGRPYRLHYAARCRDQFAFLRPLQAALGDGLQLHCDDDPHSALDLARVVAAGDRAGHLYVCGPAGMIDATRAAARACGFADDRVHAELFSATPGPATPGPATPGPAPGAVESAAADLRAGTPDRAFEVQIASSGQVLTVPPGRSILEVLEAAGLDPISDCRRGDCGVCQLGVVSGTPDHRDVVLSASERAAGRLIQVCVSRALSPRLVLDL